jgi:hypothetical protein
MLGASLPWLTLFAGLQQYRGTIGLYGWLIFAFGALALICGFIAVRTKPTWLWRVSAIAGIVLFAFTAWLLAGLMQIVHRQDVMLVARPGPGLWVIAAGATTIVLGSIAERFRT